MTRRPRGSTAAPPRTAARAAALLTLLAGLALGLVALASPASASPQPVAAVTAAGPAATPPTQPTGPTAVPTSANAVTIDLNSGVAKVTGQQKPPSQSITIILLLTVLSVAPSLLILCTSFTKVVVVLSLTRNALGLQNVPPNQVLAGLALFLSLFIMGPTLKGVYDQGIHPYVSGTKTQSVAWNDGSTPLRDFMLKQTRSADIATLTQAAHAPKPESPEKTPFTTLVPAFVMSELKSAFIIGFVVFVPFLVIDLVVSSGLMSMGMMMLPPVLVSLPFKLLLFVLVDGWGLIVKSLVSSYVH